MFPVEIEPFALFIVCSLSPLSNLVTYQFLLNRLKSKLLKFIKSLHFVHKIVAEFDLTVCKIVWSFFSKFVIQC